jgi:hypothetical protein
MLRLYRRDMSLKVFLWQWTSTPTLEGYVVTVLAGLPSSLSNFPSVFLSYNKCLRLIRPQKLPTKSSPLYCKFDHIYWVPGSVEIWAVLRNYTVYHCNSLQIFRDKLSVPSLRVKNKGLCFFFVYLTLEDGTDRLSRNVGTELPLYAA